MKILYLGDLRTECVHDSGVKIQTDAPKDNMGKGEYFSPTDLFAASLGSCMLTLMGILAKKLGVQLEGMSAEVQKTMSESAPRRISKLVIRIRSSLSLDAHIREKLEKAAIDCPVHHSIHPNIRLEIDFVWGL